MPDEQLGVIRRAYCYITAINDDFRYVTVVANQISTYSIITLPETKFTIVSTTENAIIAQKGTGTNPVMMTILLCEKLSDLLTRLSIVQAQTMVSTGSHDFVSFSIYFNV